MDTVICPKCGEEIEISSALKKQLQTAIETETEKKVRQELAEKNDLEINSLKKALAQKDEKIADFRTQEIKLREEKSKIEDEKKEFELTIQRRMDEEKKRVEELVITKETEKNRLIIAEYEERIKAMQKSVEEAQRKGTQGSQQTQGEVLELDLENTLKLAYPQDTLEPVGKGIRGADIRQVVKSPLGRVCGVILWESKRTKAWTDEWLSKLKEDLRAEGADFAVIVSTVLPRDCSKGMGLVDGIWAVDFGLVLPLSLLLRQHLLDLARQKVYSEDKGKKADQVYEYLISNEFRQQLEALVEVYQEMQTEIAKEKIAYEKIWKARKFQIKRLFTSTANVCGSLQGIAGPAMPQIKGLELLSLAEGEK